MTVAPNPQRDAGTRLARPPCTSKARGKGMLAPVVAAGSWQVHVPRSGDRVRCSPNGWARPSRPAFVVLAWLVIAAAAAGDGPVEVTVRGLPAGPLDVIVKDMTRRVEIPSGGVASLDLSSPP